MHPEAAVLVADWKAGTSLRRATIRILMIMAIGLPLVGCGAATPPSAAAPVGATGTAASQDPGGGSSVSPDTADLDARLDFGTDWFTGAASPMDLAITTDPTTAATARVTSAGGSVSAIGADGTTFTLDIPPEAVLDDVDVTLTPIATVDGWDVAPGDYVAVQLEPDGLRFSVPARLLISLATPIGNAPGSAFGFYSGGTDAHLLPSTREAGGIAVPVEHFSGVGFTWNDGESFSAAWTRHRNNQAEDRLRTRIETEIGRLHRRAVAGLPTERTRDDIYREVRNEYERDVANRRLLLASNSCEDGKHALRGFNAWNHMVEVALPLDLLLEPPTNLLDTVRYVCAEEATASCFETGDLERLAAALLADSHELAFDRPDMDPNTRQYLDACGRFDLVIEQHSNVLIGRAGLGWDLDADIGITIPLRFVSDHWTGLVGKLEGEAIGRVTNGRGKAAVCTVTLDDVSGDRKYKARIPDLDFSRTVPENETIEFLDLDLRFTEGHAAIKGRMKCPRGFPSPVLPAEDVPWVFHADPEFSIKGWTAGSHPTIATKEHERVRSEGLVGTEGLDMELIHKPGPMPPRPQIP